MKFMRFIHFFLFSLTVNFTEQSELICPHQPIVALAGDDVILPCHLEPPINVRSETVVWTRTDLNPEYVHYHQDGRLIVKNQNPSYHYRTRLFVDELKNGNVSMKIFRVKLSDSGEYKCFLPSLQKEASIQLTVGSVAVKATVGQDVILPCHLEPPSDASTLIVEWKQGAKQVHLYRSGADYLVDQDENYKDRTSLFHEEKSRGNISLKLTKVTKLDEGSYTCSVPRLHSQVRRGKVTLIVESVDNAYKGRQSDNTVHGEEADDTGLSTGGVTGIVIVFLVIPVIVGLAGIVLLVWMRRRNPEKNAGDGRWKIRWTAGQRCSERSRRQRL